MIYMGMGQKHIFNLSRSNRQVLHDKIVFPLFHTVIHEEIAVIHPFHKGTAACNLMSGTDKSDFHGP